MVSKVALANMALDFLAVDPIADLAENSTPARKVSTRIDQVIEAVLEMSDWTFARKITALANVDNTDWTERYEFKYDLPNDLLKAIRLVPAIDAPNTLPISFSLANGALYTNEQDAKLQYTWRNLDPTKWPMSFTEAVAMYLARQLAMPLTRKRSFFMDANGMFTEQFAKAVEYDAAQEQTFWTYPSEYLEARGANLRDGDGKGVDGSTYWSN
jgi:hypothetical protein